MKKIRLLSLLISPLLFAQSVPQEILDTGERVSQELIQQLATKLKQEVSVNGLVKAAEFCNRNAMTLTEEVNLHQLEGTSLKRISLKLRNAANTPSEDERRVLESMQKMLKKGKLGAYLVEEDERFYKYYKPLLIKKELCLACHGDLLKNPELNQFLSEHYPQDKATGYKMGDLRGAVLVKIKK
jgi:hypothetical protein